MAARGRGSACRPRGPAKVARLRNHARTSRRWSAIRPFYASGKEGESAPSLGVDCDALIVEGWGGGGRGMGEYSIPQGWRSPVAFVAGAFIKPFRRTFTYAGDKIRHIGPFYRPPPSPSRHFPRGAVKGSAVRLRALLIRYDATFQWISRRKRDREGERKGEKERGGGEDNVASKLECICRQSQTSQGGWGLLFPRKT